MKYRIDCITTMEGLRYRVILIVGKHEYVGRTTYARPQDAERAAKAIIKEKSNA